MRPRFIKLIATILLGIFSVFLIPNELVHELYWHKDTKEMACPFGKSAISTHHIHCFFLSYEASLFNLGSSVVCPKSFDHNFAFAKTLAEKSAVVFTTFPSLRGPPQLV